MKIRSITVFATLHPKKLDFIVRSLAQSTRLIKSVLEDAGIEVQTTRLATPSFTSYITHWKEQEILNLIKQFEEAVIQAGFDYLSIGPALIEVPKSYALIPQILAETRQVFCSAFIADSKYGVSLQAIQSIGQIIVQSSTLEDNGFANLRFTALANVEPLGPFFPAAFHDSSKANGFAFAVEGADEVVSSFSQTESLDLARSTLLDILDQKTVEISSLIAANAESIGLPFYGFDISVAPFPSDECSLGAALESLGIPSLGNHGSLAAAAFLADTLDRGSWLRTGFNGLMLPLLEDSRLAQRSIDHSLAVKDLLMYSAVCGTGLDTIPLAGNLSSDQIAALLLDVAALSARLKKPLTARLMPIPGKKAGDLTNFDFAFFRNGRILDLQSQPLHAAFSNTQNSFRLNTRRSYQKD